MKTDPAGKEHDGRMDMNRVIAEATIAKVLGRWAPHARHDLVGAWTPMSMDLAILAAKNAKSALTSDEIATFIARMKDTLKHLSAESDNVTVMVGQDRNATTPVSEVLRDIAHKMRARFGSVECVLPQDPESLGVEIRYDLYMVLLAAVMALEDRKGTSQQLTLTGSRNAEGHVVISIAMTEGGTNTWPPAHGASPPRRIDFVDVDCLAAHLGFKFTPTLDGGELKRVTAPH
jgi:hypothetical protein